MALQPLLGSEAKIKTDAAIGGVCKSIPGATSITVLSDTNGARSALTIYNNASGTLYLLTANLGKVATTLFTVQILPSGYWEMPQGIGGCYKGPVTGLWSVAGGSAMVTEFS